MQTPTMHKPVPLQTRVRVPAEFLGHEVTGTVGGIASVHVIYHYIVLLDQPHQYDGETYTALTVIGSQLMNERGEFEWRLEPHQYGPQL